MKKTLTYLISTIIFNTAIAGVLTLLLPDIPFWHEFVYSQCIGLSVMSINVTVAAFVRNGVTRMAVLCITLPGSVALGLTFAFHISGVGSWSDEHVLKTMAIGLFFGLIGAITFLMSERIDLEVEKHKQIKVESDRREIEAHLKLLQAQIEPHFLFNTLANVGSLIDSDPGVGQEAAGTSQRLAAYCAGARAQRQRHAGRRTGYAGKLFADFEDTFRRTPALAYRGA